MAEVSREQMRAADGDRRQVADQLRLALEEGRLGLTEYDERLQSTYAAKTYAELDRLLTDLPNAAPLVPAQPSAVVVPPPEGSRAAWVGHVWGSWAKAAVFLTLIWGAASLAGEAALLYWPIWILGPWGLMLLVRTVAGLVHGEPRKHAAEAEHRRRLREHKRERKLLQARAVAAGELPAKPTKEQRKAFIAEAVARGDLPPKPRRPE